MSLTFVWNGHARDFLQRSRNKYIGDKSANEDRVNDKRDTEGFETFCDDLRSLREILDVT